MEHSGVLVLCSEIHTRHINTINAHNVGFLTLNLLVKVKVRPEQVTKAQRRRRVQFYSSCNLCVRLG